jgi:AcrR family transcriptional regulator
VPRAGLNTDVVIDAAAAIADLEGLAAVTLARLAAHFRVRPPSLYRHIDGLEAVHRALALRGLRAATEVSKQATAGKSHDEALFPFAHAYWRFARENPGLYEASLRPARPGEKDVAAASEALLAAVLGVIGGYSVRGDDALHASRGLRAIVHGFVSLDHAGGFRLKRDLEESFDRVLHAFARDLAARGRDRDAISGPRDA